MKGNWKQPRIPEKSFTSFGLVRDHAPDRIKLFFRTGARFSLSYALLPIISYEPPKKLLLKITGFSIQIEGTWHSGA